MDRKTFFIDIDGTLVFQPEDFHESVSTEHLKPLPGAVEKLMQWHCDGHLIILTTARPESLRELTKVQLKNLGLMYDRLIMGIGHGPRILINDYVNIYKASSYNVFRNKEGIESIEE